VRGHSLAAAAKRIVVHFDVKIKHFMASIAVTSWQHVPA